MTQSRLTKAELAAAGFAVREFGQQRTTDFGQDFWGRIADKLAAAGR